MERRMTIEHYLHDSIIRLESAYARLMYYGDDPATAQLVRVSIDRALQDLRSLRRDLGLPHRRLEETNFFDIAKEESHDGVRSQRSTVQPVRNGDDQHGSSSLVLRLGVLPT